MHRSTTLLLAGLATLALATVPLPPPARAATAAMPSDFDGDGYADLAIGVPREDVGTKLDAGAVNVLYGSSTGLTAAGDQSWTQDSPGVKGVSRGIPPRSELPGDGFGRAVAAGDFDRDGYGDLAIGVPYDDAALLPSPPFDTWVGGAVNILYGSAAGLSAARDQYWTRADLSLIGIDADRLGEAIAAGDFDGDGYVDLAIGAARFERVEDGSVGHAVVVLYGGPSGLTTAGATSIQTGPGSVMEAGDLDGDRHADLAIGAWSVSVGDVSQAGEVSVLYGSPDGLTSARIERWSQDSDGVADQAEVDDRFGASLAIGDFDGDGIGDLAVGVPGEGVGAVEAVGAVVILQGSTGGLVPVADGYWHQETPGVPGAGQSSDAFGAALAAGDLDGDGADDLAIGVPGDRTGSGGSHSGAVEVLYGSSTGLGSIGAQRWTQSSSGVPTSREAGDRFGASLASANFGRSGPGDLAVGVAWEDLGGVRNAGMVNVLYGRASGLSGIAAQGWWQNAAGVKGGAERDDLFGWSLTP